MRPELRLVTKVFTGKRLGKKPSAPEHFSEGDLLIVYENDGVCITFVRVEDVRKKIPFVAEAGQVVASTESTNLHMNCKSQSFTIR
jgi:hypothetical protein